MVCIHIIKNGHHSCWLGRIKVSFNISPRAQIVMIWLALGFLLIYGLSMGFLLKMIPLHPATLPAEEIAAFYRENSSSVRLGALLCSWTGAFMVPLATVISAQMIRLEKGIPIWAMLQFAGGIMMSIFLVLPPLFWGIAAYTPERPAEVTLLMHEIANLTLVTTDQYFIFQFIAISVICLIPRAVPSDAFPRWFGYLSIWITLIFEAGAIAFVPKTGPFSWNGLFVFWFPLTAFGTWIPIMSFCLLRAIKRQRVDALPA